MAGQERRSGFKRLFRGGRSGGAAGADEVGVIRKPRHGRIRIALCYPNTYDLAMGNLGFHQAYHFFNSHDNVVCERAVFDPGAAKTLTIESGLALRDFEIIAFSISYEADLPNLARMLRQAGIPLDPEKRGRENAPLLLIGGVMAFLNPEPLTPFADVIAVGEGEVIIPSFLAAYGEAREKPRSELLARLLAAPGIYIPSFYEVSYEEGGAIAQRRALIAEAPELIRKAVCADISVDPARTRVFTDRAEFCDMALVEIGRGCVHGCRFCAGAFIYRPPRWVKGEAVEAALAAGLELRERAGLVAASVTDHPEFERVRSWVRGRGRTHSVASLRLDQVTPEMLADIKDCGRRSVTLAPEAGSERLRRIINKPFTDRAIARAMEMIGTVGIMRLKLYFQVGLPFETEADVEAIVPLVAMMRAFLAKGAGARKWAGKISVSVNPFVPKPNTPFQWRPMEDKAELKKKLVSLSRALSRIGGVNVSGTPVREAVVQALIARGDRRVGAVIARAAEGDKILCEYLKKSGALDPPLPWHVHRERDPDEALPWDFIAGGPGKSFLWNDYLRARDEKLFPQCRPGRCEACEACQSLREGEEKLIDHSGEASASS